MCNLFRISLDDLSGKEIAEFLEQHIKDMTVVSPPESRHVLDLEGLRSPDITFWSVWDDHLLAGCGALKELNSEHAEVKSMRTLSSLKQKGIASRLLRHIISEAKNRGYNRLSLETGSMPFFEPARTLYTKFGFQYCRPFANYRQDPNCVFMTLELLGAAEPQ